MIAPSDIKNLPYGCSSEQLKEWETEFDDRLLEPWSHHDRTTGKIFGLQFPSGHGRVGGHATQEEAQPLLDKYRAAGWHGEWEYLDNAKFRLAIRLRHPEFRPPPEPGFRFWPTVKVLISVAVVADLIYHLTLWGGG